MCENRRKKCLFLLFQHFPLLVILFNLRYNTEKEYILMNEVVQETSKSFLVNAVARVKNE